MRCILGVFYLSQSVYRRIQWEGLQVQYNNNVNNLQKNLRMLSALAFVPQQDVAASFATLKNHCGQTELPILNYFESTYVGVPRRGGRQRGMAPPMFPVALWNCYDRVQANIPRTTNNVEGWHNGFAGRFEETYPNIWKFIDTLKKENGVQHLNIAQFMAGRMPTKQRKTYRELNTRINTIVGDYANRQRIDYLRAISYNLKDVSHNGAPKK